MRFSKFSKYTSEKRFWSIEIVESMVGFKIFKEATLLTSEPTTNSGKDDNAEDFRLNDNLLVSKGLKIYKKLSFLKYIPFLIMIGRFIKNKISNRRFAAKKYFKQNY